MYCPAVSTMDINDGIAHSYRKIFDDGSITEDEARNCAIISITNAAVDEINAKIQSYRPGESRTFLSSDYRSEAAEGEVSHFSDEFLDGVNANGVPPHTLVLKELDYVFVVRNYSTEDDLMNGTKVQIMRLPGCGERGILVRHLETGELHMIPRILFEINNKNRKRKVVSFSLTRRQYPLRLCYAMTINKSMGQTLSRVAVDLRIPVFSHGQLYVALGRVTRRNDVIVVVSDDAEHKRNGRTILLNKVRRDLVIV